MTGPEPFPTARILFAIASIVLLVTGQSLGRAMLRSYRLVGTAGTVLNSRVIEKRPAISTRISAVWCPSTRYRYEVNGHFFENEGPSSSSCWASHKRALSALKPFRQGAAVSVYYDPDDPSFAVLVRPTFESLTALTVGLAGLLGLLLWQIRRETAEPSAACDARKSDARA